MNPKKVIITSLITVVMMIAIWLVVTPSRAANSDTIVIITTNINSDGSGKNRWEINGSLLAREGSTMTLEDVCNGDAAAPFSIHRIEKRSGIQWCIFEGSFDNLDQLGSDFYNQIDPTINRLEIRSNTLYYDLDIDPNVGSANVNVEWKVVAPGKIVDHNADKVSGCSLSWTLDSTGSQNIQFESKTNAGCSSGLMSGNTTYIIAGVVCCCCLLLIVIIVVVVFFVMKRKQKQSRM
jgi:hypothetical protein